MVRSLSRLARGASVAALALAALVSTQSAFAGGNSYVQTNLVSDVPGWATLTDPNLVNAWGLSASPTSPIWVADNGPSLSTLYSGWVSGSPPVTLGLVVSVPSDPTGTVFNPTAGFGGAHFLFDTEQGSILGWSSGTVAVNDVSPPGAIYKGLTMANDAAGNPLLYAANFATGNVDVFDSTFQAVPAISAGFHDNRIPAKYAPFGIQAINGWVYVTYAKRGAPPDEIDGAGLGFVDKFTPDGVLAQRVVRRGALNAPWGLALAPAGFGRFSGDLLVGNFGNGKINVYNPTTGARRGALHASSGGPIKIDGLWGLRFGNGTMGNATSLMFAAGPGDESHGLFGAIDPAA